MNLEFPNYPAFISDHEAVQVKIVLSRKTLEVAVLNKTSAKSARSYARNKDSSSAALIFKRIRKEFFINPITVDGESCLKMLLEIAKKPSQLECSRERTEQLYETNAPLTEQQNILKIKREKLDALRFLRSLPKHSPLSPQAQSDF